MTGASRSWFDRGNLRQPGPHLDRLPIGIDLAGVNLSEGLRAAVASGLLVLASVWLHSFPLLLAAFAANLACFCDAGGPLASRLRSLMAYTGLGAAAWVGFGLLRNLPWPVVLPVAGVAVFLCSMARVWGTAAQAVGNLLIVTVALALDAPLTGHKALVLGVSFVAGGSWAALLTLVIWRLHPGRPAARAVDRAWAALASLAADLRQLASSASPESAWDAHARAHRRFARMTLDEARQQVVAVARSRGPMAPSVRRAAVRLEAAETMFAGLIALGDMLEGGSPPLRQAGGRALRLLRPVLTIWGKGVLTSSDRLEPVLERAEAQGRGLPELASLLHAIADAMRIMLRTTIAEDADMSPGGGSSTADTSRFERILAPLRANLTWDSAILRHSVRATVLIVPALAWGLLWWSPYAHWLTITVALTMQPYFAATWQRVLERIGGTLLGGLLGGAVAFLPESGMARAVLLVPLCIIGFSVRQVSYGAYIACLTPLIVVLFDVAEPGHSDATIAAMRFSYTVAGGGLALLASMLLWPRWDSRRLRQDVEAALKAHAALASAVLMGAGRLDARAMLAARRAAGVASNNLEAALSRALQEPRRIHTHETEAALAVDAALRRLGGALIAFPHAKDVSDEEVGSWRRWTDEGLTGLSLGRRLTTPAPAAVPTSALARIGRIVGAIDHALNGPVSAMRPAPDDRPHRQRTA